MLRRALTAAALLLAAVVLVAGGRAAPAHTTTTHTCSATDKQFLHAAAVSSTSMALLAEDYHDGRLDPKQAIAQTREAELGIRITDPRDPSLKMARALMRSMYLEYGRAIRAEAKGGSGGDGAAGRHMYRSYTLANYAHQVLNEAQPALAGKGCSAAALL